MKALTVLHLRRATASSTKCTRSHPVFDVVRWLIARISFLGVCEENVHSLIRIAFHDAIGFSLNSNKGGGADGSMIQFGDVELNYGTPRLAASRWRIC